MTADAPLAYMLRGINKNKWVNADTECESGCGIVPFNYQEHVYTHTLQWAIGIELFLLTENPWQVILSTDHPNGGSFMNYPRLIKLLMDRGFRREEIGRVNQKAIAKTSINDLDREYSLYEIAIITRAGPARALGLKNKGHLGTGADADITIHDDMEDKELMFNAPRYVLKSGVPIISDHEFKGDHTGNLLHITPEYDPGIEGVIQPFFESYYSTRFENYPIDASYMHNNEVISTASS
jgi:formylmethanofuran dehydrogenase subunit A